MWAASAACCSAVNRWAFRSSVTTAKLAFLNSSLQRNELAMHTAPSRTARTTGWSRPPRSTSSVMSTRL